MVSTTAFESFVNRPPTPPKDHNNDVDEALQFLNTDFVVEDISNNQDHNQDQDQDQDQTLSSSAARPSPPSSLDNGSKERVVKRVEFSPCVTAHKPTPFGTTISTGSPLAKRLLSNTKPLKSILKSTLGQEISTPDSTASSASDYFTVSDPTTFPAMLESVTKLLAAQSSSSRLDGYRTLNGALKAYENLPDPVDLKVKMPLIAQSMARDITATTTKNDPFEATLTTQALKLATAIILIPSLDGCFSSDFQAMLVDKSIDIISREAVSKTIANHHMYLLASQKFSPKVMTASRAEQLVASLITIQNRVSGNSVIAARMVIFQRLLDQAPQVMLATIRDWLTHVFHGALSSIKDIRLRAVDTGIHAGLVLGAYPQATKALTDLFNTVTNDTSTYGGYLTMRLSDMVKDKELASHVPQVWSMVILFFRSKKTRLQKWSLFKSAWLLIIQKCMNSGDSQVRYRANLAWNRLIFVISPDLEAKQSMDATVNMLKIPFVSAFDKKDKDRGRDARQLAISGYCHLLHYSLRPSQTWEELDIYWDEYVHTILIKLLRAGPRDIVLATRILKALLNGRTRVWDADLANQPTILGPEDVPRLDCGWVRSRIQKILDLISHYVGVILSGPAEESNVDKTPWPDLLAAIAEAGSQEVRATVHLKETLAHLMNFLGHLWKDASRNFKEQSDGLWITRFGDLVQYAVEKIGALHFIEANLARTQAEDFEAAPTPSHRPSKHHVTLQSPMVFLFGLFKQPPAAVSDNADFFRVAKDMLHGICQGKLSRKSKLHLLRQCSDTIKQTSPTSTPSAIEAKLWSILAQEFATSLLNHDLDVGAQEAERLGTKTRDTVHMLTVGLEYCAVEPNVVLAWQQLHDTVTTLLKQEAGEGAVVLGLMEPIAETLLKNAQALPIDVRVQLVATLLAKGLWPKNRQQIDDGRRILSNSSLVHARHTVFEPFIHVLALLNLTFQQAYESLEECMSSLPALVESVVHFLQQSPGSQLHATLRKTQDGLAVLTSDSNRLLTAKDNDLRELSVKVVSLWETVLRLLKPLPTNAMLLKALDTLFSAGLNSSHRAVVNATVTFWNETFGQLDSLTYPPKVELALRRVKSLVELDLPTFPEDDGNSVTPLEDFVDSQVIDAEESTTPTKQPASNQAKSSRLKGTTPARLFAVRDTPTRKVQTVLPGGSSTPRPRRSEVKAKAKLRHDDSQVQFVAVQSSSPVAAADESQLLTDHQKEVISRQHFETAQMYPDFSSSPAPRSMNGKPRMPRLDFSAQKIAPEEQTTPMLEEHGPMEDYLGSSPTPKAAEKVDKARSGLRETTTASESDDVPPSDDAEDSDVPSSPPQMSEDSDNGIESDAPEENDERTSLMDLDQTTAGDANSGENKDCLEDEPMQEDKPDTYAPAQALTTANVPSSAHGLGGAMEVDASHDVAVQPAALGLASKQIMIPSSHVQESDVFVDAVSEVEKGTASAEKNSPDSSPVNFTDSLADVKPAEGASQEAQVGKEVEDVTRVGDSFPGTSSEPGQILGSPHKKEPRLQEDLQTIQQSTQTRSGRLKRKGGGVSATPAFKRRKQNSPLKRMYSWVTGSQEQDTDDDMSDCIHVASQPEQFAGSTETPIVSASAPASVDVSKPKRGRGRPRKSETPVKNTPVQATTRLTRNSSILSLASDRSAVVDTPEPRKSRRLTRSQLAGMTEAEASAATVVKVEVPRTVRRTMEAVVIPSSTSRSAGKRKRDDTDEGERENEGENQDDNENEEVNKEEENNGDADEGPDSQLRLEQAEAHQRERVIARPRSIMQKLRSVLADCKTMVLGSSQEHRQLDDLMFELRKEIHEASTRGNN